MIKTILAAAILAATITSAHADEQYVVQLGIFDDAEAAHKWVARLNADGIPAYTELRKADNGSTSTALRAGPFSDRAAAAEALKKARADGFGEPKPPVTAAPRDEKPFAYTKAKAYGGLVLFYQSRCEANNTAKWKRAVVRSPNLTWDGCWQRFYSKQLQDYTVQFCALGDTVDQRDRSKLGNACFIMNPDYIYKGNPLRELAFE